MATVNYFIKGNQNPLSIMLRLRDGKKTDLTISTGKTIDPNFWTNDDNGRIKQRAQFPDKVNIEKDLRRLKTQILDNRNMAVSLGQPINREWIINEVLLCFNKNKLDDPDQLTQRMTEYKLSLPNKVMPKTNKIGASHYTIANYGTTITHLDKFQTHKNHIYKLTEIDSKFHTEFIKYAKTKLNLSENTIGKDIRQIKTVCLDAKDNGYKVHDFVTSRKFNAPETATVFTTLNESELKLIGEFNGADYLNNARDWLIIGCWTGCRVGDLMELSMNNVVVNTNGTKLIQYTQSKTGKTVKVPMHSDVETILNKREGFPRPISDQRFNEYIKDVCKLSGLTQQVEGSRQNPKSHLKELGIFEKWQLIKSHTCRRSFATNHYSKLPNKIIMAVTGHGTEQMLLKYIGEVDSDHTDKFFDLWAKDKETAPIKLKPKKMG